VKVEITVENAGKAFLALVLSLAAGALVALLWAILERGSQ
jgi:hypothetical protein